MDFNDFGSFWVLQYTLSHSFLAVRCTTLLFPKVPKISAAFSHRRALRSQLPESLRSSEWGLGQTHWCFEGGGRISSAFWPLSLVDRILRILSTFLGRERVNPKFGQILGEGGMPSLKTYGKEQLGWASQDLEWVPARSEKNIQGRSWSYLLRKFLFLSARSGSADRTRAQCNHHQSVCVSVCVNFFFGGGVTQHSDIEPGSFSGHFKYF